MSKRKKRNKKKNRYRHITYVDFSANPTANAAQINQIANDVFGSLYYQISYESTVSDAAEKI